MKTIILAITILALASVAQAAQVSCDYLQHSQTHKIAVASDTSVTMSAASNPAGNGYKWVSQESIQSEFDMNTSKQIFTLPLVSVVNKFTFLYKRPWESSTLSTCIVIVKIN